MFSLLRSKPLADSEPADDQSIDPEDTENTNEDIVDDELALLKEHPEKAPLAYQNAMKGDGLFNMCLLSLQNLCIMGQHLKNRFILFMRWLINLKKQNLDSL
jgi:hypothetical protein